MITRRPYLLLLILSLIIYLPVMAHATSVKADFGKHITHALQLPDSSHHAKHVLYHAIFLFVHRLMPNLSYADAALVAILLVMLPLPLMVFAVFSRTAGPALPTSILITLSLGLTIVAPITIWSNRHMIGYLNPIVYHNPTYITARLFVIPLSLLAFRVFQMAPYRSPNQRVFTLLLSASVILMATLAKPSFTFVLLPGCCLFALWRAFRRERVDWLLLVCGICLPGLFMMGFLYLLSYGSGDNASVIAFGIFTLIRLYIPDWQIPVQFLLSLVFPLAVFALYFERARRNLYLNMCWVVFALSAAATYLLHEDGPLFAHGNFLWTSYAGIFLLMFASLLFLVEQHAREWSLGLGELTLFGAGVSRRVAIASLLFGLHVISGIAYCYRFATQY